MLGERLISVGQSGVTTEGLGRIIKSHGAEYGHVLVGSARTLKLLDKLLKVKGLNPSIAFVGDYTQEGLILVQTLQMRAPNVDVVAFMDENPRWSGTRFLYSLVKAQDIVEFLTNH